MGQVKKGVSGNVVRNTAGEKAEAPSAEVRTGLAAGRRRRRAAAMTASRQPTEEPLTARRGNTASTDSRVVGVRIRALDPKRICGAATSVEVLYRLDEALEGHRRTHLVFFDRHGWYCEHDRACPAVARVKAHHGQIARSSRGASHRMDTKRDGGER